MNKIAIDMTKIDFNVKPIIMALKIFLNKYDDVTFVLIGDNNNIKNALKSSKLDNTKYEIFATTKIITMTEKVRKNNYNENNSIICETELLHNQKIDALISNGESTTDFIDTCRFIVGEFPGISQPIVMSFIQTIKKEKYVLMLDVGTNLENNAQDLVNFAIIASFYAQEIMNNPKPSVAILNIGKEETKGKSFHKEAYKLLSNNKKIFFKGNIEPRDITSNNVDIIVTDGFTGNIALKALKGMAKNLMYVINHELTNNFYRRLKSFSLRKIFRVVRETFNYQNNDSLLILGLKAIAVKIPDSNDKKSWINILELARATILNDFIKKITIKLLKED